MLKRYDPNVVDATDAEIAQAAQDTVPAVAALFWASASWSGWASASSRCSPPRSGSPRGAGSTSTVGSSGSALCLPLPWISCELGWIVAEYGRQPWAIEGVLPTYLANSSVTAGDVWFSLSGFIVFYTTLAIVDLYLIVRTIRLGPEMVADDRGPDRPPAIAQPAR